MSVSSGARGGFREHWFEPLAEHLGSAYLHYSFTYGTTNEVDRLVEVLGIGPGDRVLDVGCGPGRHAHELARRGVDVLGVDVSETFVHLARTEAPDGATFERMDARRMAFESEFDGVFSLCQGGFGLAAGPGADPVPVDPDGLVLERMAAAVRPGRRLAISAFSAYFQVRFLDEDDSFDAASGVNHERTTLKSPEQRPMDADLWTSCFTPRELRLLADRAGLTVRGVWSVTPGDYRPRPPDLESPEYLLVAERPAATPAGPVTEQRRPR